MASYLVSPMGQLLAHFSRSGEGEKTGLSVQIIATVARLVRDGRGMPGTDEWSKPVNSKRTVVQSAKE